MFSKILIKLVDQAVLPAILLLATRIVSVIVLTKNAQLPLVVGSAGFIYSSAAEYTYINSYSILTMLIVLTVGVFYILLKAYMFHDSHITPHLTAKLFSVRLSAFIQTSFDLYAQGAVWLSYMYLMLFVSAVMAYVGILYSWVFIVSGVLAVLTTVLFVFDVENEASLTEKPFEGYVEMDDEYELRLGGVDAQY